MVQFGKEELEKYLQSCHEAVAGSWYPIYFNGLEIRQEEDRLGTCWSLWIDGFCWMCTHPIDFLDHSCIHSMKGSVLLTGLGLGLGALFADQNPLIDEVTIVESDWRVAQVVWPMISEHMDRPDMFNFEYRNADLFEPTRRWNHAFLDHARVRVPEPVIAKYSQHCDSVKVWYDELQEALACQ